MAAFEASIEHALTRNTVRLTAAAGESTSVGTGFLYKVAHPKNNIARVFILTNKHVLRGADFVNFVLSSASSVADLDEYHQPKGRVDNQLSVQLSGKVISHPNPDIDLCAIDITLEVGLIFQQGQKLRSMIIDSSWLPNADDRKQLRDIEQVFISGYPTGLWDTHNNMPIARKGSTATHPLAHYCGKRDFLVDVAAFPGSSGSPVFSYEGPMYRLPNGSYTPGTKVKFIGVVWGVIERATNGQLIPIEIPSATALAPQVSTSLNLAIALHGDAVLDIDELAIPGITLARKNLE